jgi:anthranilate synthase/aminodeoxychorismate synthase-like glutamine amidotransferase
MRVLVLDNYDSFTWNLVQLLEAAGAHCDVRRSDALTVADAVASRPDRVVISPGPFGPERTGICRDLVRDAPPDLPILGVCLGMQVIASVAGAGVVPSGSPVHGKQRLVEHSGQGVLAGLPSPLRVGLYHSLVVQPETVADPLVVTAREQGRGTIMGCALRGRPVEGVLFHPESFLTDSGDRLLDRFLEGVDVVG